MTKLDNKIVQEVGVFEIVGSIGRKNKKYQAIILQEIEKVIDKDSDEYKIIRKIVLDELSNYTRAVVREVFGDIEVLLQ